MTSLFAPLQALGSSALVPTTTLKRLSSPLHALVARVPVPATSEPLP
jgi:hypothetical protein